MPETKGPGTTTVAGQLTLQGEFSDAHRLSLCRWHSPPQLPASPRSAGDGPEQTGSDKTAAQPGASREPIAGAPAIGRQGTCRPPVREGADPRVASTRRWGAREGCCGGGLAFLGQLRGALGVMVSALLLACCSAPGRNGGEDGPHYYCAATTTTGSGPTLVVTEQVFSFNGPIAAFPAAAPQLQASFAAYAVNTWAGMTIAPVCYVHGSHDAAYAARQAKVGRYEGQGYAIWRVSYWRPGRPS